MSSNTQSTITGNRIHEVTDFTKYSQANRHDLIDSIISVLNTPAQPTVASTLYSNEVNNNRDKLKDEKGNEIIAKLCGRSWTYNINKLSIAIGRNSDSLSNNHHKISNSITLSSSSSASSIDVDLGPGKVISRKHASIKYNLTTKQWELRILGRNGAKVNFKKHTGSKDSLPVIINSGSIIEIGSVQMMFVLTNDEPYIPLYSFHYLIPKLVTMYGLNGNNNKLLFDIINTSKYVKGQQKLGKLNVFNDIDDVTEDEINSTINNNTIINNTIITTEDNAMHNDPAIIKNHDILSKKEIQNQEQKLSEQTQQATVNNNSALPRDIFNISKVHDLKPISTASDFYKSDSSRPSTLIQSVPLKTINAVTLPPVSKLVTGESGTLKRSTEYLGSLEQLDGSLKKQKLPASSINTTMSTTNTNINNDKGLNMKSNVSMGNGTEIRRSSMNITKLRTSESLPIIPTANSIQDSPVTLPPINATNTVINNEGQSSIRTGGTSATTSISNSHKPVSTNFNNLDTNILQRIKANHDHIPNSINSTSTHANPITIINATPIQIKSVSAKSVNDNAMANGKNKNKAEANTKRKKPNVSYATLITKALLNSSDGTLQLNGIYSFIESSHPYYDRSLGSWQNSVRHNLSSNAAFEKFQKQENGVVIKGAFWRITDSVMNEFLGNWYSGKVLKFKKTGNTVLKELQLHMSKHNFLPGQKPPSYYKSLEVTADNYNIKK